MTRKVLICRKTKQPNLNIVHHNLILRLFNAKLILLKEQLLYYLIHTYENKRVHTFCKVTRPKVNVTDKFEFELAYNSVTTSLHRLLIEERLYMQFYMWLRIIECLESMKCKFELCRHFLRADYLFFTCYFIHYLRETMNNLYILTFK